MSREDWLRQFRERFPFASNRVSSLADAEINVASIHRAAYERLLEAADEARARRRGGLGVLLWGDPGVGKSHLLQRFAEDVQRNDRGLFLLIHNLLASPRQIPAAVVRCFVARLAYIRSNAAETSVLYDILYKQLRAAVPYPQGRPPDSIGKEPARRLFSQRIAATIAPELPDQNQPDIDRIAAVLFSYFLAIHKLKDPATKVDWRAHYQRIATVAEQYLQGYDLDSEAWELLEVEPSTTVAGDPTTPNDQFLETVALVLLELARQANRLVVLCFDQVENLSDERFVELFRFNHALLDHGRNLLVITAGVRSDLVAQRTRGVAPEAAWDRLASDTIDLYFISLSAARELLEARLRPVWTSNSPPADIAEKLGRDPLFPLGEAWWASRAAGLIEARPRDVISWAHARWREQCRALATDWDAALRACDLATSPSLNPPPTVDAGMAASDTAGEALAEGKALAELDERVEQRLRTKRELFCSEPSRLPADSGQLTGLLRTTLGRIGANPLLVRSLFSSCEDESGVASDVVFTCVEPLPLGGRRPTYDLLVQWRSASLAGEHPDRSANTGVVVMVTVNATSTAAAYRRLCEEPQPAGRVVVLMDERVPEKLGVAGERYRDELESREDFEIHFIAMSLDEYRELSALEAVLADARSGDLEVEKTTGGMTRIGEKDVEASYARRRHYRASPLLRLVLTPPIGALSRLSSQPVRG